MIGILIFLILQCASGQPYGLVNLIALVLVEARVDFNHSRIYDEFDFKGQSSVSYSVLETHYMQESIIGDHRWAVQRFMPYLCFYNRRIAEAREQYPHSDRQGIR